MKISSAVVADLALLTDALDEAGADVLESALRLQPMPAPRCRRSWG